MLWRFNRRRFSAEEIRDSMLAVSGRLNLKAGGRSVMAPVDKELVRSALQTVTVGSFERRDEHDRRSIYLIAKRNLRVPFMEVFDATGAVDQLPGRANRALIHHRLWSCSTARSRMNWPKLSPRLTNVKRARTRKHCRARLLAGFGSSADEAGAQLVARLFCAIDR